MTSKSNTTIKILHLISTLNIGGAEKNLSRLIKSMDKNSYNNLVVSMTTLGVIGKELLDNKFNVHTLNMKKGIPDPRGILRLKNIIYSFNPDIIQCWMYHANLLGTLFNNGRHLIWNIRCSDMDLNKYGLVYKWSVKTGRFLSKIPDIIVFNSYAGKAYHEQLGYNPQQWEIIPNGFDTEVFKPDASARQKIRNDLNIPDQAITIGIIAQLDPMKDHETFFRAAGILACNQPGIHFVLAGRGLDPDFAGMKATAGSYINPENIHLLGERTDIPHILNSLDISTLSSLSEGLPNVIGESMACGIPCVSTDVGDSGIILGDTGIVVPKHSPIDIAEAWKSLIMAGPLGRDELGRKARQRIVERYSMETMTRRYESLYNGLTSGMPVMV